MAEATAQEMFSGTKDVAESHKFNEANLAKWMEENVEGYEGPLVVKQFKGGQSNPTYKLFAGGKTYVMRRKPPGKLLPSAHAVDREYRVQKALAGSDVDMARLQRDAVLGRAHPRRADPVQKRDQARAEILAGMLDNQGRRAVEWETDQNAAQGFHPAG